MYKTKIQELCQRRSWRIPEYETTREGPDHNPRFTSTVIVNAIPFRSPTAARTAKQAQNDAAMQAFLHFVSPSPSPSPSPLSPCSFPQHSLSISGFSSFPQPSLCESSPGSSGPSFDVDNILRTNRVLQPRLEEGCQTSPINSPVTVVRDTMTAKDHKNMSHLYKNQLQSYAQKRNLNLPVYSSEWEGPPHAMRFKCRVTVDGQTYESDKFYSSLKHAEHAAAEVALLFLSPDGVQEDRTGLYKNLLQELVQKEGFGLPIYSSSKYGEAHMPIFVSQVEVEGELFTGQEAKSKKQAEMSAAKAAYMALKERKGKLDQSSYFPFPTHEGQAPEFSSDHSESKAAADLPHNTNPNSLVSLGFVTENQQNKDRPKEGFSSYGNATGCTEGSSLSNDKSAPFLSDSTKVVSDTGNGASSTAVDSTSQRKKARLCPVSCFASLSNGLM
ncbi:double-stranded RNA-binding protein 6-like isoform X2 [Abrus precatorius]|uniref:Double-stranded RNA-binding protein 6-like isoform X2 n=1 Tax=Abrus precatorius TaxID=3816 RepID=A0A8B8LTV3_ABRPR|nr:double-stranded RNA-binding protein 6-like isoform X2 [Abrus precatorius]